MKTLKNLIIGIFLLCLMAACSKEEPQNICDCNIPKPYKEVMRGQVRTDKNKELSIYVGGTPNMTTIICNKTLFNNMLKKVEIGKDSIITIEAYKSDICNTKGNNAMNLFFFYRYLVYQK